MYTVFDIETSGFISPNYPPIHPKQGRILQIAALLLNAGFKEVAGFHFYIKMHDNLEIHPKAFETHGITKEMCDKFGVPIELPLMLMQSFLDKSELLVAHNVEFDAKFLAFEDTIAFGNGASSVRAKLKMDKRFCTMREAKNHTHLTQPSLEDLYHHCFKEFLQNSHDAMKDCRAAARIFQAMKEGTVSKIIVDKRGGLIVP